MNKVILVGNMAADAEIRQTASGVKCAQFRLAVRRRYANQDGGHDADFINIVCWRGSAEIVEKWTRKGSSIGIAGSLQTRSYEAQDGTKRYVTEVVADEVELLGGNNNAAPMPKPPTVKGGEEQQTFTQVDDDDLPF